ncbi:hypothetical protein HS7_18940 [Sulfolobales archaeon HS-7]|nr:hypothetical protein HS7_18940 [Sulfolobales archaeon HS-7]
MTFKDLREYLAYLRERNNLITINDEVSVNLEIAEISRNATYLNAPTLLFTKIRDYPEWKMVTNLFNSVEAIYNILGTRDLEGIASNFFSSISSTPYTLQSKLKSMGTMIGLGKILPKNSRAQFQERKEFSIKSFPALRTWPKDAGTFFTFSLLVTQDPDANVHNVSVYRMQIVGDKEVIVHWQALKRGRITAQRYLERRIKEIPAAIVNGVDPVIAFVAASPVPPGIDKYLFAGILRNEGVRLFRLTNGLRVPATAESVIEGYVDMNDTRLEGPFGDHLGYYTPADYYPVFKAEKFYTREEPIFHATSVGKPPLEDAWIGKGVERIFLPFLKMIVPELVDMNLPIHGLFTGVGIFSINKVFPGQGKKAMLSLWGVGQLSLLKIMIIVDKDVNVHDFNHVIYALSTTVDPKRDVVIIDNITADSLDHTTERPLVGSRLGIDATRKTKEEVGHEWPEEVAPDDEISKKVEKYKHLFKQYKSP